VLEQKIRERRQTYQEFAACVEEFAREHKEPGTLGVRHLQRLAAGRWPDGRPVGRVLPTTARLLEQILGVSIDELLTPPSSAPTIDEPAAELRQRLQASSRVDEPMLAILQEQVNGIRRLDRQLGATVAHEEVLAKITQVTGLLNYNLSSRIRERLAALLSELHCLAGWQALDLGRTTQAWSQYTSAVTAAQLSGAAPYIALAAAGRAFVLTDIGASNDAVEMMAHIREATEQKCSRLLRSWLAAAHGEVLIAHGQSAKSLVAFDQAVSLLPNDPTGEVAPYVALNPVHLARWRGHALAKSGDRSAVDVLTNALNDLDDTFVRAETALRVDLCIALFTTGREPEAINERDCALQLANQVGSIRQARRLEFVG
jgi:tetratricopeptide (TPR) repeat protein